MNLYFKRNLTNINGNKPFSIVKVTNLIIISVWILYKKEKYIHGLTIYWPWFLQSNCTEQDHSNLLRRFQTSCWRRMPSWRKWGTSPRSGGTGLVGEEVVACELRSQPGACATWIKHAVIWVTQCKISEDLNKFWNGMNKWKEGRKCSI